MKFDSNQAWKDAAAAVSANRDLLLALAGVFMVLPAFALALLLPPPEQAQGADFKAMMAQMGEYYRSAFPALIAMAVLSILGTLTMLTLFTDRSRPTVGEAIRQGLRGIVPVIAAQLLTGFVAALAMIAVMSIAQLAGAQGAGLLLTALLALGFVYAMVRLSLLSPVVIVEGQRNPVAALKRSWELTRGNAGRLLAFYLLLGLALLIVYLLATAAIGLVVTMIASGGLASAINNLVATCLEAVMSVYFVAVTATSHRQLAGPSPSLVADRFE